MGLTSALNTARTALNVNQKAIEVVGNNIANVNTDGYSRQSVTLSTYPSLNFGDYFIGTGVVVTDVERDYDTFVASQILDSVVDSGYYSGQSSVLSSLEDVFAVTDDNLSTTIDNFFDAWSELSTDPSDLVLRDTVIDQGELLCEAFNSTAEELEDIQDSINDTITAELPELNSILEQIAELNETIYQIESRGQSANSARDERDQLAEQIAESLGADCYETSNGMLTVQLSNGLPLVQGDTAMVLGTDTTGSDMEITLTAGGITRTLDSDTLGGEIGGLLEMRDEYIPELMDSLDRLAYEITTQINYQHSQGTGLDGSTGVAFFSGDTATSSTPTTPAATDYEGYARSMSVSITDSNQIAAGNTSAEGDNENALVLAGMGTTYLIDGMNDFNSYYADIASQIGVKSSNNTLNLESAEDTVEQLETLQDGLTGVSLDEEMIDLIVYQRSYQSSAQYLTTVDEMMETLINII